MNALLKKMRISAPHTIATLNAPADFEQQLGLLPEGIRVIRQPEGNYDSLHWFVKSKADVDKQTEKVIGLMKPGVTVWGYYPKGSSKVQTDLTRDKGWETLMQHDFQWLSLISFDDTWSAFAFRMKTEADKRQKPEKEREIFKYADSATKTITLPEDLAKAFTKNKKARATFDALAFSHRREYVEWIVTAKREETRNKRVEGTLNMLLEGKKNPQDR